MKKRHIRSGIVVYMRYQGPDKANINNENGRAEKLNILSLVFFCALKKSDILGGISKGLHFR